MNYYDLGYCDLQSKITMDTIKSTDSNKVKTEQPHTCFLGEHSCWCGADKDVDWGLVWGDVAKQISTPVGAYVVSSASWDEKK